MMLYSRQEAALTAVLLAAGLLPMNANAYVSFSKNGEELINTLHTHIYSPTLSLPSSKEIKVAKVCFITDVSDCSGNEFSSSEDLDNPNGGGIPDYDLDDAERCRNEGYTLSGCPDGFTPSGKCPYGDYYAKCVEACPSNYVTCDEPYVGVGEACGGKYASCTCTPCEAGFDYTEIPEGYIQDGEACLDCDGATKYKVKVNPCDGFMDCGSMGGEVGAETCLSGTVTKYDNCKPCPNLGTLTSCPSPYTCTYEECSNRYYKSGCQSGYDWDSTSQTCTQQCSTSYKYTCTGSNESPKGTACNEKYTSCQCDLGYEWSGGKCVACNSSYYKFTCANTGGGVGESCGGLYSGCRCGPSRVWNGETCISTRCQTVYNHDKLYSDMTPESDNDFAVPIAQIVCSYEDGGGQALALNSVGSFKIGGYGTDISSLPNYSLSSAGQDLASCENSKIIMASGNKNTYPAVWAAHEYSTEGTEAGDWCLPAAGIFAYARQECLGSYFEVCIRENYVTSTEIDSTSQWVSAGSQQEYGYKDYYTGLLNSFKTASYSVLPVIPFCPEGKIYDKTTDSCVTCDSSYQYTCYGAQGYAGGVGKACSGEKGSSGKYKSCNCKDNFVWNGSACVFQNACTQGKELGYILYSDMTRSANLVSGKTPIGVVICSYANGGGQAVALKSLSSGSPWYYSSNYTAAKISNIKRYSNYKEASQDVASCENSRIIMAAGDKSYYPAVWAVNEYSTEGTNPGDWCLPAAGVYSAYIFYYSKIGSTLKKLGSGIGGVWTSTVGNSEAYYADNIKSYETYGLSGKAGIQVARLRPVIEF